MAEHFFLWGGGRESRKTEETFLLAILYVSEKVGVNELSPPPPPPLPQISPASPSLLEIENSALQDSPLCGMLSSLVFYS